MRRRSSIQPSKNAPRKPSSATKCGGVEEHAVAKRLIKELKGLEPSDERFEAKLSVLIEPVKHHADEEEKTMFPMVRAIFGKNELQELGQKIKVAKGKEIAPARQTVKRYQITEFFSGVRR